MAYSGVKPTGPLPKYIDFPLLEGEEEDAFSILLFGDSQVNTEREVWYFDQDIVAELLGVTGYEFGLSVGDMEAIDWNCFRPTINQLQK